MNDHDRPPGTSDETVQAVGRLSEAFEYLIRARGHLYALHQLSGRVDLLTGQAADELEQAGHHDIAAQFRRDLVGRNVMHGRWTFQLVEEFDDAYYHPFAQGEAAVRGELMGGRRHVYESEMKDDRRSDGEPGHERRPPD